MLDNIKEAVAEWVHDTLAKIVLSCMNGLFTQYNNGFGTITSDVAKTPQGWNPDIFGMVRSLSETVMMPIAGTVVTYVLCYELISMIMQKNSLHDIDTWMFFKYVLKAGIAVYLISHTFDLTMAVFDVGRHAALAASGVLRDGVEIDAAGLTARLEEGMEGMGTGEMFLLTVAIVSRFLYACINAMLYVRIVNIYLYISIAPVPFSTLTNREWGSIGTNYIKGLFSRAFQAFFIIVAIGIYAVMVTTVTISDDLHWAVSELLWFSIVIFMVIQHIKNFSTSIFGGA